MRTIDKIILGSVVSASVVGINYNISLADNIAQDTYITTNRLNMRKGPSTSYAKIGTLNAGQKIVVIGKSSDGNWAKIKYNSQEVWVSFDYLKKDESQDNTRTTVKKYKTTANLNMRKGASTSYARITTISQGTVVTPISFSQDGNWAQVKYNNQTGWISVTYIKLVETSTPVEPDKPDTDSGQTTGKKYKTTGNLNARKGPATTYSIVTVLKQGTEVEVVELVNGGSWAKVKYQNQYVYVSTTYLELVKSDSGNTGSTNPGSQTQKFSGKYIIAESLTLRKGPGKSYQAIFTIPKGSKVEASEITSDECWIKVTYSGQTGWIDSDYISEMDTEDIEESIETDNTDSEEAMGDEFYTTASLNLRIKASSTSSIICQIPGNAKVTLVRFNSDASWAKVMYNKTGWVLAKYLNDGSSDDEDIDDETDLNVETYWQAKTTENLNLRSGPSTTYSVKITIPKNATVKVYEEINGWAKVKYNSYEGYCSASYIIKI